MLLLDVDHPQGAFQAEYDPESGMLFSHNLHVRDLLWAAAFRPIYEGTPSAFLLDVVGAIVGYEGLTRSTPVDRLEQDWTAITHERTKVERRAENTASPRYNFQYKSARPIDCTPHIDGGYITELRTYSLHHMAQSESTVVMTARTDDDYAILQTYKERDAVLAVNAKGALDDRMLCADRNNSALHQTSAKIGCVTFFRGSAMLADPRKSGTPHYRPADFDPRYITAKRQVQPVSSCLVDSVKVAATNPITTPRIKPQVVAWEHKGLG